MNDATEREMERLRRLIDQESQAGLGRFHSRDFRPTLEGRLRERLLKKPVFHIRHPAILGLGVAFILLMAALLAVFLPYIEVKREIREIREILMRMPEMGESIASMRLSPMDEETKMRILLTWIFKQADDRLNPREWSAGGDAIAIGKCVLGTLTGASLGKPSPGLVFNGVASIGKEDPGAHR